MRLLVLVIFVLQFSGILCAQNQTVGLFQNSLEAYNGYTLFSPLIYTDTYLIDNCGKLVHSWTSSYKPGNSVYLLENGQLLRTGNSQNQNFQNAGGAGGIIELFDAQSNVLWSYTISDNNNLQHHDIEYLPNGNILAIVWTKKTESEAIEAGRNPSSVTDYLWSEKIVEINPENNEIIWEWHVWDHLVQDYDVNQQNYGVVSDNPGLINLNYYFGVGSEDWLHFNSIDYNPDLDQIVISVHNFHEIWIIDHSTTTIEASSHAGGNSGRGGDLLFRWGNPQAYDMGTVNDQVFFAQHDARWIESGYPDDGKIMVYNNGVNRPEGNYSSVDMIIPALNGNNYEVNTNGNYLPEALYWQYVANEPTDFYSQSISGASQLANGNVLICEGESGHFFEVTSDGDIVWDYISPVSIDGPMTQGDEPGGMPPQGNPNSVFRISRYSPDYSGLNNLTLDAGDPIELNPLNYECELFTSLDAISGNFCPSIYPNPVKNNVNISLNRPCSDVQLLLFDCLGKQILSRYYQQIQNTSLDIEELKTGFYILKMYTNESEYSFSFIKQ
jgi:hypothetical protein